MSETSAPGPEAVVPHILVVDDDREIRELLARHGAMALRRAFAKLVGNAVAYGGAAWSTSMVSALTIAIEDDGPGVAEADRARAFEPFVRLEGSRNRATSGLGLGLPIARELLRGQGWELVMGAAEGGGARLVATRVGVL